LFSKRGNYFLANEPANEFASAFDLSSQISSNHLFILIFTVTSAKAESLETAQD